MTDNIRVRERKRRTAESEDFTSSSEVKKLFPPSNKVRKRRTINTKEPLQVDNPLDSLSQNFPTPQISETTTPEISTDEEKERTPQKLTQWVIDENKVTNLHLSNTIDKIKAEIRDESRYNPDSSYSEGYQGFLDSFE